MTALERAIESVVRHLDEQAIPYMIFGGLANLRWGRSRLTEDVDVKVQVDENRWDSFITGLSPNFTVLPKNPAEFARTTHVIPAETAEQVRVDFVLASLPYEREAIARAVPIDFGTVSARLCTAEDLILHKVLSSRSRDREDVEGVILRQRAALDRGYLDPRVRDLSMGLEQPEILAFYQECLRKAGLAPI